MTVGELACCFFVQWSMEYMFLVTQPTPPNDPVGLIRWRFWSLVSCSNYPLARTRWRGNGNLRHRTCCNLADLKNELLRFLDMRKIAGIPIGNLRVQTPEPPFSGNQPSEVLGKRMYCNFTLWIYPLGYVCWLSWPQHKLLYHSTVGFVFVAHVCMFEMLVSR